jgi:hypothetical protein
MIDSDKLFVYGTLLQDAKNPVADFLREYSELIGRGYFKGELYDIGSYPGLPGGWEQNPGLLGISLQLGYRGFVFNPRWK